MDKNPYLTAADSLSASFDESEKKWREFYSQPLYDITPNNYSPQAVAPHGANARTIDMNAPKESDLLNPPGLQENKSVNQWDQIFKSMSYNEPLKKAGEASLENVQNGLPQQEGFDFKGGATQAAQFGLQAFQTLNGKDASEKESWAKAGQLTMNGAMTGAKIGGPWGAAIGGGVGAIAGVVNLLGDSNERNKAIRKENKEEATRNEKLRARDYEIAQANKEIENLQSMSKSQLNYIK